jgi:four helix bundle protein
MMPRELEQRMKRFAILVIRFVETVMKHSVSRILTLQLIRSATSVGANYREANRAESKKDFIHKIAIVEKEVAESQYWLELLQDLGFGDNREARIIYQESRELLAIFTRIGKSAKLSLNSQFAIRNSQSQ